MHHSLPPLVATTRPSSSPYPLPAPPTCSSRLPLLRCFFGLRLSAPHVEFREQLDTVAGIAKGTRGCDGRFRYCSEIHVGSVGHPFRTCRGMSSDQRRGEHDWGGTLVEAVFLPVEAYHLEDCLGPRIPHNQRFAVPRIPALVELCIQAGVDLPEYPTKCQKKAIIKIRRKEFVDANEDDLPDPEPDSFKQPILEELPYDEIIVPSSPEETAALAEETLEAWETVRNGTLRLMKSYAVRVCGYCPELHIGSSGHKARNCGAFKHQQRNGQHGWQAAVLDDLIPPRYVWHIPESGELQRELKTFYGQAPAVVEMCIQHRSAGEVQSHNEIRYRNCFPV